MNSINAYFSGADVYFSSSRSYRNNQVLVEYLKKVSDFDLDRMLDDFLLLIKQLELSYDMQYDNVVNYYKHSQKLERIINNVEYYMRTLPPYDTVDLDDKPFIFDKIYPYNSYIFHNVGYEDKKEYVLDESYVFGDFDSEAVVRFDEINREVKEYCQPYLDYLSSLKVNLEFFRSIIVNYLSERISFPEPKELASIIEQAFKSNTYKMNAVNCSMNKFEYKIITDNKNNPTLCERIVFKDIGSFLYYDFFRGLNNKCFPMMCKNCGEYFFLEGGKYTQYCDNPLEGTNGSTCRSVGARQRYADKCKSDPILGTYEKAYKAHYARVMKKKMTKPEFSKWVPYAQELKQKAYEGELEFEEYRKLIRK